MIDVNVLTDDAVNVNVSEIIQLGSSTGGTPEKPYIDSSKLKYGAHMFSNTYGTDLSLLDTIDTSEMVDMSNFCYNRTDLTKVPNINVTNSLNCRSMFYGCNNMSGKVVLDSPKVESFNNAFQLCEKVTEISIKTDSCTQLGYAFAVNYGLLEKVTLTDTSKVTSWVAAFNHARNLHTIEGDLTIANTDNTSVIFNYCGALKNIRFKYIGVTKTNLSFASCSNLTVESLLSILNALSDNSAIDTTYTVTLGATNLAKLTDDQIAIATAKNINLA